MMKGIFAASGLAGVLGIVVAAGCGTTADTQPGSSGGDNGSSSGGSSGSSGGSSSGKSSSGGSGSTSGSSSGSSGGSSGSSGGSTSSSGGSTSSSGSGGSTSSSGGDDGGTSSGGDDGGGSSSSSGGGSSGGLGGMVNDAGTITGAPIIAKLLALTKNCTTANAIPNSHTYKLDDGTTASICSLKGGTGNAGGAIFYTADMDVDCDGIMTPHCPGTGADKDCCWQNQTSFYGPNSAEDMENPPLKSLAAEYTPYVVVPEDVKYPGLDQNNGGNIIAVIYNNQLEFGVFGDQGPSDIIGEASYRTAQGLGINPSPARGGVGGGVTYIVFVGAGSQPADMENLTEIQTLGAQLAQALVTNNP